MQYNERQQAAISAPLGPMLIVAGPGTGKTATLVGRIRYLIEHQLVAPEQILAISFTRKAAAELRQRLRQKMTTTTIHALALQLIRGAQPDYKVADNDPTAFDLLLNDCLALLRARPDYLRQLQAQWQYILVDEFQDVDRQQLELINLLAQARRNLCVIGDPDQSIYGFRGASPQVLLNFQEQYPQAQSYFFEKNYRSPADIVSAAAALIQNNTERFEQQIVPLQDRSSGIIVLTAPTAVSEANAVVAAIQQLVGASDHLALAQGRNKGEGESTAYSFGDIAVICRLHAAGNICAKKLQAAGLPTHRIGEQGVFEAAAVRDFMEQLPRFELINSLTLSQQLPKKLQADQYSDFRTVVESFDDMSAEAARQALLNHQETARPEDDWQPQPNTITLLTAHAAKGLEFPIVFIVGADDGIFPYLAKASGNLEEERRLFYVAMTRAQHTLIISGASQRTLFGKQQQPPRSRFIEELPKELLSHQQATERFSRRPHQTKLF